MTIEIGEDRKQRALHPPVAAAEAATGPGTIIWGARAFAVLAAMTGVAMSVADLAGDGTVHLVMPALTSFLVAGQSTVILCVHAMIAERGDFYRRGQLDGWMRGWRGQEPHTDDPLLK